MAWTLILFLGFLSLTENVLSIKPVGYTYDFGSDSIVNLRSKRQSASAEESGAARNESMKWWVKNETEYADFEEKTIDYKYYEMTIMEPSDANFNKYYLDILAMLKPPNTSGIISQPMFRNAYERTFSIKLRFEFPFYGDRMKNLSVATGGFCYIGDESRSWLATTRYIAPLMADFDTSSTSNFTVMFVDNGTVAVVEWSRVRLRDDPNAGNFTFQVSLHKNGDIWFVYKEVPMPVTLIKDIFLQPRVGISTTLRKEPASPGSPDGGGLSKHVNYEKHNVDVDPAKVKSKTVVILRALPS